MKRNLLVLILALFAFGCSRHKVVEAKYDNGNPRIERYYHKKSGELILDREVVYYANKQVKMDGEFQDDLRHGMWKAWYQNGTLWSEGEYKEGKRNGTGIFYHQNGKKYIEGLYLNDVRVGAWKFYDTTGALTKEIDFDLVPKALESDSLN
mgnify:CR=1 FL=1